VLRHDRLALPTFVTIENESLYRKQRLAAVGLHLPDYGPKGGVSGRIIASDPEHRHMLWVDGFDLN